MSETTDNNEKGREPMTFKAFQDYQFTNSLNCEYKVMINPQDFERNFTFYYNSDNTQRNSPTVGKFAATDAEKYTFTLIIDGTGIVDPNRCNVQQELDNFLAVLFTKTVEGYQPNFVEMSFCNQLFHCTINTLKITYNLFNRDGSPLRAKISCTFSSAGEKLHMDPSSENNDNSLNAQTSSSVSVGPSSNESAEAAAKESLKNDSDSMMSPSKN